MVTLNFQHGMKVMHVVNVTWLFLPHQDRRQFWAHQPTSNGCKSSCHFSFSKKIDSPEARLKLQIGVNSENTAFLLQFVERGFIFCLAGRYRYSHSGKE